MKLLKLSIGIVPARTMFRVSSLGGLAIDELLKSASSKTNSNADIYENIEQDSTGLTFRLTGRLKNLSIGHRNIAYTADHYDATEAIKFHDEVESFKKQLKVINGVIHLSDITRIGIVCEYRVDKEIASPSADLLEKITKFQPVEYPGKFLYQLEHRHHITNKVGVPTINRDDFWNVIESIYDSESDANHSKKGKINLTLDVQRYYYPMMNGNIGDGVTAVATQYEKRFDVFTQKLKKIALQHG